jgi:hypothetical protein
VLGVPGGLGVTPLDVGTLRVLTTGAMPVSADGGSDELWATIRHNLSQPQESAAHDFAAVTPVGDVDELRRLADRKAALLLPEYLSRYHTVLLDHTPIDVSAEWGVVRASATVFASLVRARFLAVSVWLKCDRPDRPAGSATRLSSIFADKSATLDIPTTSRIERLLIAGSAHGSPHAAPELHAAIAAAVLREFGGQLVPRDQLGLHPSARFDGTVATLESVPDGFIQPPPGGPQATRSTTWQLAAAELLPTVLRSADNYRAEYLRESLGTDVMDSADGHYFLGRRRILGLITATAAIGKPDLVPNLETWTQLLCESAALQLAAIRTHAATLERTLEETRSPGQAADQLIASQHDMHQDMNEAHNLATSLDPIFWHHQEVLKRVSGLTQLARDLLARSQATTGLASLQGERWLGRAAQSLTVLAAVFAAATLIETLAHDLDASSAVLVSSTGVAAVLAGAAATALVRSKSWRGGRRTTRRSAS